jgi:hypothetical protein
MPKSMLTLSAIAVPNNNTSVLSPINYIANIMCNLISLSNWLVQSFLSCYPTVVY